MNFFLQQLASLSPQRKLGWMGVIALLVWGVQLAPAYAIAGPQGLEGSAYAAILCLLPGWLVVYLTARYPNAGSPLMAMLLGMGLRMACVLVGIVVLMDVRPGWGMWEFYTWLLCDYFAFLAIETAMVVPVKSDDLVNSQGSPE